MLWFLHQTNKLSDITAEQTEMGAAQGETTEPEDNEANNDNSTSNSVIYLPNHSDVLNGMAEYLNNKKCVPFPLPHDKIQYEANNIL